MGNLFGFHHLDDGGELSEVDSGVIGFGSQGGVGGKVCRGEEYASDGGVCGPDEIVFVGNVLVVHIFPEFFSDGVCGFLAAVPAGEPVHCPFDVIGVTDSLEGGENPERPVLVGTWGRDGNFFCNGNALNFLPTPLVFPFAVRFDFPKAGGDFALVSGGEKCGDERGGINAEIVVIVGFGEGCAGDGFVAPPIFSRNVCDVIPHAVLRFMHT